MLTFSSPKYPLSTGLVALARACPLHPVHIRIKDSEVRVKKALMGTCPTCFCLFQLQHQPQDLADLGGECPDCSYHEDPRQEREALPPSLLPAPPDVATAPYPAHKALGMPEGVEG